MKIDAIAKLHVGYRNDPKLAEYATLDLAYVVVKKWLAEYPDSTLLLGRARNIVKDVSAGEQLDVQLFQCSANVLPAPQCQEVILSQEDIFKLHDEFWRAHGKQPNTLLLPANCKVEFNGAWFRENRKPLDYSNADGGMLLFGQLKVIENAPRLAVALL